MSEIQRCKNCNVEITWKLDETQSRNRMWEKNDWHRCDPKSTTIVHPKAINWHCWECGHVVDINNHPCIHYQKLDANTRASIRMESSKKKN